MAEPKYTQILWSVPEPGIALITLNRPDRLNAFTATMITEWVDAINRVKTDRALRVLVVTGAGRGFCSGADVSGEPGTGLHWTDEKKDAKPIDRRNVLREGVQKIPRALVDLDKPYIAAINGVCVGGGMEMANMCDIRIASTQARFGEIFMKLGSIPGDGGCYFLPRIVGIAKAIELICTGDIIDAQEALRINYVSKVVPPDQLLPAAMELARRLAKGPPIAVGMAKRLIYRAWDMEMNTALEMTELMTYMNMTTEDREEAKRAKREKREPVFKGE
ncbi:MAG: enoyl-CoA hydratase/isomerase family protein [Chloroflexi bacterium]|nr:enoyl-CoA hydratase/isomerase family protein [Chloroflexota bacterium]